MIKLATLLLLLVGLALIGLADRDGRIAHGDVVARSLGYALRVEVTIERSGRRRPLPAAGCLMPDSLARAVAW